MLSLTRIRESAPLLGAILVVVALISALAVGMVGFLAEQATDGVRSGLDSRAGPDLALRASLRATANSAKQDAEVRAAIAASFAPTGVDMQVWRSVEKRVTLRTIQDDGTDRDWTGMAASYDDAHERIEIVDGAFGDGGNDVIVQAEAAEALGLVVGEQLLIDGARFTVRGTWRAVDYLDARWYGDPMVVTGLEQDYGPFVIDEASWSRLQDLPRVRWTMLPDVRQITSANLASVAAAWAQTDNSWRGQVDGLETLEKQGRFAQTAAELGVRVTGLAAIQPVVLLLLAAIAIVALAELGRLLATTRADETALIWSRGASALDIALATAVEVGAASAAGMLLGGAVGVGALMLATGGTQVLLTLGAAAWAVPAAGALSASVLAGLSAYQSAGRQTVRDPADASGRVRRLTAPGLVALVVAGAGLTVWQLRLYGSPVTPSSNGGSSVDPIAVVAPALALIAVVLLVVLVFPIIAGLGDRVSARRPVTSQLAARTVARRVSLAVAPLVVVALATGSTVVAAAYSATWNRSFDITSALRAGADVHATSRLDGIGPMAVADVQSTAGVALAAPVEVQPLSLGGESGSIVAASPDAVARLATTASGSFDPESAATAIDLTIPAPELPADTARIGLDVHLEGFAVLPELSLWIVDSLGVLEKVSLEAAEGSDVLAEVVSYGADLPPSLGSPDSPRRVLSLDVRIPDSAITGEAFGRMTMRALTVAASQDAAPTEVSLDQYWIPDATELMFSWPNGDGTGLGFLVYSDTLGVRMTPSIDGTFDDRVSPPVLISQQLANVFDVGVGDSLSYSLQDGLDRITARIAGIVPAVPGAPTDIALLMDLTVIQHFQLRVTGEPPRARDVWVSTSDPQAVALAIRPAFPANARIVTALDPAGRQVLGSAAIALWAGSIVCGLLALIGVAVAARAQLRSRRGEVAVLRAIGLGSSDQAGIRIRELATVLCAGVATGLIAGAIVALLTVPQLARAAIPAPYPAVGTEIAIDVVGLAIGLGSLAIALAIIVAIAGAAVAALARRALPTDGGL